MKKCTALLFSAMFILTGCGKTLNITENVQETTTEAAAEADSAAATEATDAENTDNTDNTEKKDREADSSSADGDIIVITLHPEYAPITCENFERLVNEGFYDGLTFHRVIEGFMAQGGDPMGTGMGGSSNKIKGEFSSNGVDNKLSHTRGVVSMARSMEPDSASSQFFICYDDSCTFLDGNYAAFGEVTEGMEVVDDFLKVPRSMGGDGDMSSPDKPIIMEKVVMIDDDSNGDPRVQITMNDFLGE